MVKVPHKKKGEEHEYKRQPTQVLCDESLFNTAAYKSRSHLISVILERSKEKLQKQQLPLEGRGDERRGQVLLSSRLVTLSILPRMLHLAKLNCMYCSKM